MDFIDYYKTLGLDKSATQDQIRAAYRKLARKHHPDLNPNDKEANKKFQEINEANEVLSDPEKRKKYDQYGKDWQHADAFEQAKQSAGRQGRGSRSPFPGGEDMGGGFGEEEGEFSSFFESLFGRSSAGAGRGGQSKYRGQDYQAELTIGLEEAAVTHPQTLTVNGKNIRITIPAGIENGQVIKLKGHGGPGANGGPAGDLFITFSIPEHPRFRRSGNDLYTKSSIDLYTGVLGGETTVDTLGGKVKIKVKPGTQSGATMRLKGKGFPFYKKDGHFGDMYVNFEVRLPENLTEKEKELFTELARLRPSGI